jgi:hypothetical protein
MVGYFSVGLQSICQEQEMNFLFLNNSVVPYGARARGFMYLLDDLNLGTNDIAGLDISSAFAYSECSKFSNGKCYVSGSFPPNQRCLDPSVLENKQSSRLFVDWNELSSSLVVYNNAVLNLTQIINDPLLPDQTKLLLQKRAGADASKSIINLEALDSMKCIVALYTVAYIGNQSIGCTAYSLITGTVFTAIVGLIVVRFLMAFIFHWIVAPNLVNPIPLKPPSGVGLLRPQTQITSRSESGEGPAFTQELIYDTCTEEHLYTICLVTCYSEGKEEIKRTLDSISGTKYPDERKLLVVICDGLIMGQGNDMYTHDIVTSMISLELEDPEPRSYLAIADGEKQHNMAKIVV